MVYLRSESYIFSSISEGKILTIMSVILLPFAFCGAFIISF